MPGPPPKPASTRARRNNPKAGFGSLPAEGRQGPPPPWPLSPDVEQVATLQVLRDKAVNLENELEDEEDGRKRGRLRRQLDQTEMTVATMELQIEQGTAAEVALWEELWATPQATMWDESSAFNREVAQYVRWKIRAEQGNLNAGKEARMLADRLGLNPLALLRLRREVEETNAAEERGRKRRGAEPAKGDEGQGGKPGDGHDPRGGLFAVK